MMNFRDALLLTIDRWTNPALFDEWLFETFRDNYVEVLQASQAYELIGETIDVLLEQDDESAAIEVLQTAIALARRSRTTQIPDAILEKQAALRQKFAEYGSYAQSKFEEFRKYYRLSDEFSSR